MKLALADDDPRLRAEGRRVLAKLDPVKALPELEKALEGGALAERQAAFATLGKMERREADRVLASWLDRLLEQKVPAEVRLDLLEAAAKRQNPEVKARLAKHEAARSKKDHLAAWRETLAGGDAEAGRRLFLEKSEVSCLRCHKVNGLGGEVGPDLTGIGGKQTREYLLESLVEPTKQIAKGYDTVVLVLTDGQQKSGIVKGEDRKQVQLMTPEGTLLTVPAADIEQRLRGKSAMPEDLTRHLSRAEVRDLVEFLSGLR